MWHPFLGIVSSGDNSLVLASLITTAGAITAAMLTARNRGYQEKPKAITPKPRRVSLYQRVDRLEQWKEQKVDPLIEDLEGPEKGGDDERRR